MSCGAYYKAARTRFLQTYLSNPVFYRSVESDFPDHVPPSFDRSQFGAKDVEAQGFNPGLIVLLVVGGLLITFLVGNYVLYMYAQKTLPPRKKKPVSKKKLKREKLKQGVSVPGE
ncbi:hypothetical protein L2E82_28362 [Cichorium intybus]|uniref:Uncharacterized protein n=1 Tax=Cichorium intybus TaxID=13427 RepID=A0ACB9CVZ7_CICIN|nr:hypothetical protein L2E82_28362 [Cichorium intybus]